MSASMSDSSALLKVMCSEETPALSASCTSALAMERRMCALAGWPAAAACSTSGSGGGRIKQEKRRRREQGQGGRAHLVAPAACCLGRA